MTDQDQGQAARPGIVVTTQPTVAPVASVVAPSPPSSPSPSIIRARRQPIVADSGRATARAMLNDALSGVDVTPAERRFLSRLSQWDKRNATIVASLLARARQSCQVQAGSAGAVLAPEQLDIVLAALMDAFAYRTAGAAACWDCAGRAGVMCGEHARDAERARAFADLAAVLSGKVTPAALARLDPVPEYRHQAAVAS